MTSGEDDLHANMRRRLEALSATLASPPAEEARAEIREMIQQASPASMERANAIRADLRERLRAEMPDASDERVQRESDARFLTEHWELSRLAMMQEDRERGESDEEIEREWMLVWAQGMW